MFSGTVPAVAVLDARVQVYTFDWLRITINEHVDIDEIRRQETKNQLKKLTAQREDTER